MLRNKVAFGIIACAISGITASNANASFVETFAQVGNNVVATGSGTLNLDALGVGTASAGDLSLIWPSFAIVGIGDGAGAVNIYSPNVMSGPSSIGSGALRDADSSSGTYVGFDIANHVMFVSSNYISGSAITDSITIMGTTLASLGLTPGSYLYTVSTGQSADSVTFQIGAEASGVVPEPESIALLGIGVVGFVAARRRRK